MVREEYEALVSEVSKSENVSIQVVKLALSEIALERYDKEPRELAYHSFTNIYPQEQVNQVKRYLTFYLDSIKFQGKYPALYKLLHD
ncbi:hypothetical protein HUU53_03690 [Candidatus Micrarchaeota archaeon]|nr:hypothetical protein [Candidatus Micrarchaeota archaeon]